MLWHFVISGIMVLPDGNIHCYLLTLKMLDLWGHVTIDALVDLPPPDLLYECPLMWRYAVPLDLRFNKSCLVWSGQGWITCFAVCFWVLQYVPKINKIMFLSLTLGPLPRVGAEITLNACWWFEIQIYSDSLWLVLIFIYKCKQFKQRIFLEK